MKKRTPEKGRKLPDYLNWDDVIKILVKARLEYRVKDFLWCATLAYTGIRVGELVNIRVEKINPDERKIKIVQGKGCKDRYIIAPDHLIKDLLWYANHPKVDIKRGALFPQTTRSIQAKVAEISEDALGEHVNCHKFRHSFAIHWLKSKGNLRSLQIQLGHADLSTTAQYLLLTLDDVREDFDVVFPSATEPLGEYEED